MSNALIWPHLTTNYLSKPHAFMWYLSIPATQKRFKTHSKAESYGDPNPLAINALGIKKLLELQNSGASVDLYLLPDKTNISVSFLTCGIYESGAS